jgi:hypothetical protein
LCELERTQLGVDIIVGKSWCILEALKCILYLNDDRRSFEAFWPGFEDSHIDVIVIDLRIEKCNDQIGMIYVPAILSDKRNETTKICEFYDTGLGFSEIRLLVAFNYLACFVLCGAVCLSSRPIWSQLT